MRKKFNILDESGRKIGTIEQDRPPNVAETVFGGILLVRGFMFVTQYIFLPIVFIVAIAIYPIAALFITIVFATFFTVIPYIGPLLGLFLIVWHLRDIIFTFFVAFRTEYMQKNISKLPRIITLNSKRPDQWKIPQNWFDWVKWSLWMGSQIIILAGLILGFVLGIYFILTGIPQSTEELIQRIPNN